MPTFHERESYQSWGKVLAFAALLAGMTLLLTGCGWGPGPRSDGEQQEMERRKGLFEHVSDSAELERIRRERQAGQYRDIRQLTGGGK